MPRTSSILAGLGLALLAAWLWFPALTPVHVEGFSASIEAIARHLQAGDLDTFDRAYGLDARYFILSRLGMNLIVAGGIFLAGGDSALAMRAVMLASLVVLVAASLVLARRYCGNHKLLACAAVLLIPGIGQSAFFFNDNLTSAALAAASLAVVAGRADALRAGLAGVLFGAAVLTRADAALLAPALVLIVLDADLSLARRLLLIALGGAVAAATVIGVLAQMGANPLDLLTVFASPLTLWGRGDDPSLPLREGVYAFGVPALLLALLGATRIVARRRWLATAFLVGVPALILLVYGSKLYQARQFLPLVPFAVPLIVEGLVTLGRDLAGRRLRQAVALAVLAIVALLPLEMRFSDGPRAFAGQLLHPLAWRHWQGQVEANFAALADLAGGGDPGTRLIVTDDWNTDRYTHLMLLAAGYVIEPAASVPACGAVTEPFVRGDRIVQHVRLHVPFVTQYVRALPTMFDAALASCLAALPAAPVDYVATWATAAAIGATPATNPLPPPPWPLVPPYDYVAATRLDAHGLTRLRLVYQGVADLLGGAMSPAELSMLTAKLQ